MRWKMQFSLRTLLIVSFIAALVLGLIVRWWHTGTLLQTSHEASVHAMVKALRAVGRNPAESTAWMKGEEDWKL